MAAKELFAAEEWRRHGAMVPASIAGIMLVAVHNYTLGAMVRPLEQEFGWSRADITAAAFFPSMAAILIAPLVGMAIDRIGVRRIALAGVPAFCACLMLLSRAGPDIRSWLALYFLLGMASMLIFPTVWTSAINARFDRNRGKALALTLAGTGLAAFLMPGIATALIGAGGWRMAYMAIGAGAFVVVYPLVLLLFARDEPERLAARIHAGGAGDRPLLAELVQPRFLKLAGASLAFGLAGAGLTTNAIPILTASGFTPLQAAGFAGLIGIGSVSGRLAGGFLLDHFDARRVAALTMILPALAVALLLGGAVRPGSAALACVLIGLTAGAEYDACAYLAARHFGMARFGALFGTIGGILLFANGVAPMLMNRVYDLTRSYDQALWAVLPLLALAAWAFLALGPGPDQPGTPDSPGDG